MFESFLRAYNFIGVNEEMNFHSRFRIYEHASDDFNIHSQF